MATREESPGWQTRRHRDVGPLRKLRIAMTEESGGLGDRHPERGQRVAVVWRSARNPAHGALARSAAGLSRREQSREGIEQPASVGRRRRPRPSSARRGGAPGARGTGESSVSLRGLPERGARARRRSRRLRAIEVTTALSILAFVSAAATSLGFMVKGLIGFAFALTTFIVGTTLIIVGAHVLALALVLGIALPGASWAWATRRPVR